MGVNFEFYRNYCCLRWNMRKLVQNMRWNMLWVVKKTLPIRCCRLRSCKLQQWRLIRWIQGVEIIVIQVMLRKSRLSRMWLTRLLRDYKGSTIWNRALVFFLRICRWFILWIFLIQQTPKSNPLRKGVLYCIQRMPPRISLHLDRNPHRINNNLH